MEEAKVTMMQRKTILRAMENGQPLPLKSSKALPEIKNLKSEVWYNLYKKNKQKIKVNGN